MPAAERSNSKSNPPMQAGKESSMAPYSYDWQCSEAIRRTELQQAKPIRPTAWTDGPAGFPARLKAALQPLLAVAAWIHRRYRQAETVRELRALDDRILRDIGLRRDEIAEVARAPRRRPRLPRLTVIPGGGGGSAQDCGAGRGRDAA